MDAGQCTTVSRLPKLGREIDGLQSHYMRSLSESFLLPLRRCFECEKPICSLQYKRKRMLSEIIHGIDGIRGRFSGVYIMHTRYFSLPKNLLPWVQNPTFHATLHLHNQHFFQQIYAYHQTLSSDMRRGIPWQKHDAANNIIWCRNLPHWRRSQSFIFSVWILHAFFRHLCADPSGGYCIDTTLRMKAHNFILERQRQAVL